MSALRWLFVGYGLYAGVSCVIVLALLLVHRGTGARFGCSARGRGTYRRRASRYVHPVPDAPSVLFCMACGRGAHAPTCATAIGDCPDCGGQRWSNRPELPILGEPKERAR
jgi:hypothetical protein